MRYTEEIKEYLRLIRDSCTIVSTQVGGGAALKGYRAVI